MIANIVTVTRLIFSVLLLFFPSFSYISCVLYLLCGVSDVLDGWVARFTHSESNLGAVLDSVSDFIFVLVIGTKVLPVIKDELSILLWIILIALFKLITFSLVFHYFGNFDSLHTIANRLTGIILFFCPMFVLFVDFFTVVVFACSIASVTSVLDFILFFRKKKKAD